MDITSKCVEAVTELTVDLNSCSIAVNTWYNVLSEPSKTLTRTGGSRLVGSSSQVDILKSRGRLLYSKHPVGSKSSQRGLCGRLMQFYMGI
jgi:hypothetical protein